MATFLRGIFASNQDGDDGDGYVADDLNALLKATFISMAPPMFVHSSIAVLITTALLFFQGQSIQKL